MSTLQLYFLGTLDVRCDGQSLPKPATLKSQSLLAYLALHRRQPQLRERLAGLFWGDRPEHKARGSLATGLWRIRRCLPDKGLILSTSHTIQFDPQADLWLDVEVFETQASQDDVASLQSAVVLYRGDFMDGFYDDWIINERYRLETLFIETLARLMVGQEAQEEHDAALLTALHLLERNPLWEDAHRLAIRAHCRLGRRNAALEQYRRCREVLWDDLGTEPMIETNELYQAILKGHFEIGRATEAPSIRAPEIAPLVSPVRSPLDAIAPGRLIGREQELAFLHERWQEAVVGQGGLVFVNGEAGVGKSRLVEEFTNRLHWQGICVLWGRCYEFERLLPYQPVAEALRSILPTLNPSELADLPAWIVAEVARLAPELAEQYPDQATPTSIRSDQERARLFEGVARFLIRFSSRGALLIVLEDLHWASDSTLQLLHYLTRHLSKYPVLLVGTLRPEAIERGYPWQALQQQLSREGLATSLSLTPLSPTDVEAMIVEMSGAGQAAAPLAERLYRETEGNPFFVIEIVKALFETGAIRLEEIAWQGDFIRISEEELPLPAGVSETIQARVHRLEEDVQEALRLAAVLGREFDFDLLDAIWEWGEEATLEALDDLLRHRLIDEGTGPLGRDYAFTHHKIQEVVYAGMSRRRRQHAHARVGAAMERLYGAKVEPPAGELAFHFEEGRQHDETLTEKASAYLLGAGDRARGLYAHEEAIDYYRRALTLLKEQEDHERAARTLMRLGLTYHNGLDFRRARRAYQEGFDLWQQAGEAAPMVTSPALHTLRISWYPQPTSLDPTIAQDISSGVLVNQLFAGLVETSPQMEIVPNIAQSWEVSEGGRKYVFHLRDDASWSDGSPVTAEDLAYAWKRVLDPATGSPNASLLYDIKGAEAFHRREGNRESVGVRALDEVTLLVELEAPTGYFLHMLAHNVFCPVPRHIVETNGEAWTEVGNIVTSGPFKLTAWDRGTSMILTHNPEYHGQFKGNVQQVELSLLAEPTVRLELYETGSLDILDMTFFTSTELDRARQRHAGEYVTGPCLWTFSVKFDTSRAPFDDPLVRQAFTQAVDREALADVILRGHDSPATGGFIPPGMPGYSEGIGLPYNPARARQLLAGAGYPDGRGFPAIALLTRQIHTLQARYLQAQWRDNLGIEVALASEAMEYGKLVDKLRQEQPNMFLVGWSADYPDPTDFLRAARSNDWPRWQNQAYDLLVEKARRVIALEERIALYRQADRILMEEAVLMPLYYAWRHLLVKSWVKKYPTSALKSWFWKDVVIEPH